MPDPRLVILDLDAATQADLFAAVAAALGQEGMVRASFADALQARERAYPTGLDFEAFRIALPHVDPEHVNLPGLVVCRNRKPIDFMAMDDHSRPLAVELTLWPVVTDPQRQVGLLAELLQLLGGEGVYQQLLRGGHDDVRRTVAHVLTATADEDDPKGTV